mgnify:CR=1 FL=1
MKRFWKFILSFIAPKKMEIHRDMSIFIAIVIFLACALLSAGVPALRIEPLLKKNYLTECYAFEGSYDSNLKEEFNLASLPTFELNSSNEAKNIKNYETPTVYDLVYQNSKGDDINLKIVYDFSATRDSDITVIDMNEYLSFVPFNEDHSLKQRDILVVYTKNILYYIFNHGYTLGYIDDKDASLDKYHYLYIETWLGKENWSLYKTKVDEDGNISKDANGEINYDLDSNGNKVYKSNLNQIFTCGNQTSIGIFSYLELSEIKIKFNNFKDVSPLEEFTDILVYSSANSVKVYSFILSLFYNVLLPILWVFVMWLVLRKGGELTRFREYYSICACTVILPSIITAIVGLFIPYTVFAKFQLIVSAIWYFVVVSIINTMKKKKQEAKEIVEEPVKPLMEEEKIVTQEIKEIKEEQEKSHVSKIG